MPSLPSPPFRYLPPGNRRTRRRAESWPLALAAPAADQVRRTRGIERDKIGSNKTRVGIRCRLVRDQGVRVGHRKALSFDRRVNRRRRHSGTTFSIVVEDITHDPAAIRAGIARQQPRPQVRARHVARARMNRFAVRLSAKAIAVLFRSSEFFFVDWNSFLWDRQGPPHRKFLARVLRVSSRARQPPCQLKVLVRLSSTRTSWSALGDCAERPCGF